MPRAASSWVSHVHAMHFSLLVVVCVRWVIIIRSRHLSDWALNERGKHRMRDKCTHISILDIHFSWTLQKDVNSGLPTAPLIHGMLGTPCESVGLQRQTLPLCSWAGGMCSGLPCTRRWWKMWCSWRIHELYQVSSLETHLHVHHKQKTDGGHALESTVAVTMNYMDRKILLDWWYMGKLFF